MTNYFQGNRVTLNAKMWKVPHICVTSNTGSQILIHLILQELFSSYRSFWHKRIVWAPMSLNTNTDKSVMLLELNYIVDYLSI